MQKEELRGDARTGARRGRGDACEQTMNTQAYHESLILLLQGPLFEGVDENAPAQRGLHAGDTWASTGIAQESAIGLKVVPEQA